MHKKETENKDFMIYLLDKFNISYILFDLVVYAIILYCFHRMNNITQEFNIILLILILNLLIYKKILFK